MPRFRRGRLLLAASFVLACDSARETTSPPLTSDNAIRASIGADAALASGDVERYTADVELLVSQTGTAAPPAQRHRYRVDRNRGTDGVWTDRTTFEIPNTIHGPRLPVTMIRRDGDSLPRFLDSAGRELDLTPTALSGKPSKTAADLLQLPSAPGKGRARRRPAVRTNMDALVLLPGTLDRRLERIRRRFGPSQARMAHASHALYRARRGDLEVEAVVDESLGVIVEEKTSRGGRMIGMRRSEITRLPDNTPVVSRIVSEHARQGGEGGLKIEQSYRNINIRVGGPAQ